MIFELPKIGQKAIRQPYFPTRQQELIFRASEYVPYEKIAQVLRTDERTVRNAAAQMGLPDFEPGDLWLRKGIITIVRRLWHTLNYEQMFQLLDMDEQEFARMLREEDFFDIKLGEKPDCEPVYWEDLTAEELEKTKKIRQWMQKVSFDGVKPFDFKYDVPDLEFSGEARFKSRLIYCFSGQYMHAFDMDSRDFCPDEMLEAYQKLGFNGIFTQGVFNQLAPFPFAPELSEGYEHRIARMQDFAQRLKKYGMKLYLYLNEPRALPVSFFEKHPQLRGHQGEEDKICLCVSHPAVQEYLREAIAGICRAVPDIGGFFAVTRSENYTNCYSHATNSEECTCPRCKQKTVEEVVAQTLKCFADGAHSVNPDIQVMAFNWRWDEFNMNIIRNLPKDVIVLSQSETGIPFNIGGVSGEILDYSMSIIGPGDRAKEEWKVAKECGLETAVKMQMNTTWECSTIPALPVYPSVEEHMRRVYQEGASHLIMTWTLGGYPSKTLAHAAQFFFEQCSEIPESPKVKAASQAFVEAFKEYPFHWESLYFGPHNAGPATPLFAQPTGFKATMTCFAYDDVDTWRSIYPRDVYEDQFGKLCSKWKLGLDILEGEPEDETVIMAQGAYCMFTSAYNQLRFYRAREQQDKQTMKQLAVEEEKNALLLLSLMNKNAAIGFEAANHYYYSRGELAEKVVNCQYLIENL